MKAVINFVMLFFILLLGNMVGPEYIYSASWKTTLFATAVCFIVIQLVEIGLIVLLSFIVVACNKCKRWQVVMILIFAFVAVFAAVGVGLYSCDRFIDGFAINGTLTYIVLTMLIGLLSCNEK